MVDGRARTIFIPVTPTQYLMIFINHKIFKSNAAKGFMKGKKVLPDNNNRMPGMGYRIKEFNLDQTEVTFTICL